MAEIFSAANAANTGGIGGIAAISANEGMSGAAVEKNACSAAVEGKHRQQISTSLHKHLQSVAASAPTPTAT
jgi:hypothetical protein